MYREKIYTYRYIITYVEKQIMNNKAKGDKMLTTGE